MSDSSDSSSSSFTSSDTTPEKKRKKKKKSKSKRSSSSSEESGELKKYMKKLEKKGKLKSGRHRTGLPVVRETDWTHETLNTVLAGKKFDINNLTDRAFIAGILNSIVDGEEYKRMRREGETPVMVQKLRVLNEIIHNLIRSDNFHQAKEFYYTALEDIEVAEASWKDDKYWEQKLNLFRTLSRPDQHGVEPQGDKHGDKGGSGRGGYVQTESICRNWNRQQFEESSPHVINGTKVFHLCIFCFKKDPVVLDDHQADFCPRRPTGQSSRGGRGGRPPRGGGSRF